MDAQQQAAVQQEMMTGTQETVPVNEQAARGMRYAIGETYYRNKENGIMYGKALVQGNYLPPELEEMVAVSETQLVPVNHQRSRVAGEMSEALKDARRRSVVRSVPRFDAHPNELNYQHKPVQAQAVMQIRDPDGELAQQAHTQAQAHAQQTLQATAHQADVLKQREQIDAKAAADYAELQRHMMSNQAVAVGRQTHQTTADLANSLVSPVTTAESAPAVTQQVEPVPAVEPAPAPSAPLPAVSQQVDLTSLG